MKLPTRAKKCQEIIDNMVDWLSFYMGNAPEFRKFVKTDIKYLEEYLSEISEEYKIHNIRFASKLKALWKKEMQEKEEVIEELKQEIEELKND